MLIIYLWVRLRYCLSSTAQSLIIMSIRPPLQEYSNIIIARENQPGLSKYDISVFPVYLNGNILL